MRGAARRDDYGERNPIMLSKKEAFQMQVLILYFSKSGNTRRLAEAIAKGVEDVEGVNALLKRRERSRRRILPHPMQSSRVLRSISASWRPS